MTKTVKREEKKEKETSLLNCNTKNCISVVFYVFKVLKFEEYGSMWLAMIFSTMLVLDVNYPKRLINDYPS